MNGSDGIIAPIQTAMLRPSPEDNHFQAAVYSGVCRIIIFQMPLSALVSSVTSTFIFQPT